MIAPAFLFLVTNTDGLGQIADLSGRTPDSIRQVITLVANHQMRSLTDGNYSTVYTLTAAAAAARPIGNEWDYPWGVDLYGLLRVSEVTGDTNLESFVLDHDLVCGRYYAWLVGLQTTCTNADGTSADPANFYATTSMREIFRLDIPGSGKLDYCGAMTAQLLEAALFHANGPTAEQAQIVQKTSNYISHVQGRLPDGTLYRPEANYTVWADDLYMSCPFLVRCYQYSGDTNLLEDAIRQITNMAGYLQDTNGIWFHGYYSATHAVNGIKWGRANGWAMVATTEVLSALPVDHPARPTVLEILRRHIQGIESVQAPDGMWRQVLDNTNLWEETSCSAMFSYCIARAVNQGWVDPTNLPAARKGFAAVCTHIRTNGVITGTCQGTSLSTDINYYIARPRPDDDMHGRGAVLLAGSELLRSAVPAPAALRIAAVGTQAVVSWPQDLAGYSLQTGAHLADWSPYPAAPASTNGEFYITDEMGTMGFYQLQPPFNPNFEAELLSYPAYVTTGATNLVAPDSQASGGAWMSFRALAPGNALEFTLPAIPAGTYNLGFRYRGGTSLGMMTLQLDGQAAGNVVDQYRPTTSYVETNLGAVVFPKQTRHTIRLEVTGKNASSTTYNLSADKFTLTPP